MSRERKRSTHFCTLFPPNSISERPHHSQVFDILFTLWLLMTSSSYYRTMWISLKLKLWITHRLGCLRFSTVFSSFCWPKVTPWDHMLDSHTYCITPPLEVPKMARLGRWFCSFISCTVAASPRLVSGSVSSLHPLPPPGHSAFLLFFSHSDLLFHLFPLDVLSGSHLNLGLLPSCLDSSFHVWSTKSSLSLAFPLFGMNAHTPWTQQH